MGLTFPSDLFDQRVVGTVTGISGFGAGMAGTVVTLLVGGIVDKYSYMPAFLFVSFLPLFATVSVIVIDPPGSLRFDPPGSPVASHLCGIILSMRILIGALVAVPLFCQPSANIF